MNRKLAVRWQRHGAVKPAICKGPEGPATPANA